MTGNEQIVYDTATTQGQSPLIAGFVVSQAQLESANFTSHVFQTCNNAFGMKYVGQAGASACGPSPEGDSYAKYDSLEASTIALCNWIKKRQSQFDKVKTIEEYSTVLKNNGYYGASLASYTAGLKRYYAGLKQDVIKAIYAHPEVSILTAITVAGVVGYYAFKIIKRKK